MDYIWYYESPLGKMMMAGEEGLSGLWFMGQKYFPAGEFPERYLPVFAETCLWLDEYFAGKCPEGTPRLSLRGTPFRKAVWDILLTIPYGKTMTYGEIAQRMGNKMSAQAVGGAVGHNPVSLIVPCHRVVGFDGSLTGYAGGIERKRYLLSLEEGTADQK